MGALGGGQVVVACIENIRSCTVCVIAGKVAAVYLHGHSLAGTGGQHVGLGKAYQSDGGFFNVVFFVIVGVGRLGVNLHDLLAAVGAACVRDFYRHIVGVIRGIVNSVKVAECKIRVGQAVAERVGDLGVVVVACRVARTHDDILVPRLVVAVADINALGVDDVVHRVFAVGVDLNLVRVTVDVGAKVLHGRGGERVLQERLGQMAAGRDLAGQNLADGRQSRLAHVTNPQAGINAVIGVVQEVQLQSIGTVQQHNDLFNRAVLFQCADLRQHFLFFLGQVQRVAVGHSRAVIHGQIGALTADTAQGDNSSVTVLGNAVQCIGRVGAPRHLVDGVIAAAANGARGAAIALAVGVEVPQRFVHR